ncbi:hypothetical protein, partial [Microbacterium sp. HSID17254]|uniref:hypothetical protein n=1 Tax=Microbacterium sp. HSID17254 TaxID=2419509 RepID=UPI0011D17690
MVDTSAALSRSQFTTPDHVPADSVELYLAAPRTVGILHTEALRGGHRDLADAVEHAHDTGLAAALDYLSGAALLKVGRHTRFRASRTSVGAFEAGAIPLATVTHLLVAARDGRVLGDVARPHHHLLLARTVVDLVGHEWPVDLAAVWAAAPAIVSGYQGALLGTVASGIGGRWSHLGEVGSESAELIEPDLTGYVTDHERVVCRPEGTGHGFWDLAGGASRRGARYVRARRIEGVRFEGRAHAAPA